MLFTLDREVNLYPSRPVPGFFYVSAGTDKTTENYDLYYSPYKSSEWTEGTEINRTNKSLRNAVGCI